MASAPPATLGRLRTALVHDWLTGMRGGERCLERIAGLFPDADIFTLVHKPGAVSPAIERHAIHTSPLSSLPNAAHHYRKLLPLFPWAIQRFDLSDYDLVISTSHAVAKGVPTRPDQPHLSYCFTPMRYIWDQSSSYLSTAAHRTLAAPLAASLRSFDRRTAASEKVNRFVAISRCVAQRIERSYARESSVVHPPVELSRFPLCNKPRDDFFLLVGGFVPYKRDALVIDAFRSLPARLIVAGDGPMHSQVSENAPDNVQFVGRVSDTELAGLMGRARGLIYPQLEDFGITAVEAQASGTPVIAFRGGGALETVAEGMSGSFFERPTPPSLLSAIEEFERRERTIGWDAAQIRKHAEAISAERFDAEFRREVDALLG
ncbi:MAG: glycosyltransferase [Myxococcota bacterium]|nr:glycosyltransferase [Myxococcota bacterium]